MFLVVTFTLRAAPFLLIDRLRDSAAVAWLGARMPVGIMVILVVHTLREPVTDDLDDLHDGDDDHDDHHHDHGVEPLQTVVVGEPAQSAAADDSGHGRIPNEGDERGGEG